MGYAKSLMIAFLASQTLAAEALSSDRANPREPPAAEIGHKSFGQHATRSTRIITANPLDRVATAVDGAESSHGADIGMWRPDPAGPQGPMQVSAAAATDVGGGDRFDLTQNRAIGRAYLAQLYGRYRNWPDAIAAYNWGLGNMDAWVKAGRPPDKFLAGVAVYLSRVLNESGLCEGSVTPPIQQPFRRPASAGRPSQGAGSQKGDPEVVSEPVALAPDSLISAACSAPDGWVGAGRFGIGSSAFSKKLDQAMQLALQRAQQSP
jgi:hypothetical protein